VISVENRIEMMTSGTRADCWARAAFGLALLLSAASPASAQLRATQPALLPPAGSPGAITPGPGSPGASLTSPGGGVMTPPPTVQGPALAPAAPLSSPMVPAGQVALSVSARFGRDLPPVGNGIHWRVYADRPDGGGVFRLIKEERTASPVFMLPPGGYVVHATFGLASAAKTVMLRSDTVRETLEIPAGGIRLEGRVGDVKIPPGQISFDVFRGSQFDPGDKRPVTQNVVTSDVVLLPEGTYHIVSNYGESNSMVRSDIRVQSGKLTDVTVTHRAAVITLKLVGDRGGEALANTQWSVLTPGGDVIKESIGAFPRVVLAEGEYKAIARNEGKSFERDFKVINGVDGEVEVLGR
jgi:hypothetical protein